MAASAITPTAGHSIQTCGNEKSKKSRRKPRLKLVSATNSTATRYSSRAFFAVLLNVTPSMRAVKNTIYTPKNVAVNTVIVATWTVRSGYTSESIQ